LVINGLILRIVLVSLKLPSSLRPIINFYFSNMMALSCVRLGLMSKLFVGVAFMSSKSAELGIYTESVNSSVSGRFRSVSNLLYFFRAVNPVSSLLFFSLVLFAVIVLLSSSRFSARTWGVQFSLNSVCVCYSVENFFWFMLVVGGLWFLVC
jgi:hypothetical protein